MLQVFAIKNVAISLYGRCNNQGVIPGELIAAAQMQSLGIERL